MNFLTDEILKGTDWRAVERAIARIMSHCGWSSVRVVGRRGDGGGDVIGIRQVSGRKAVFVVQVKSVMGQNYIGPSAIQEAVNALPLYGGEIAVVATNGDFRQTAYKRRDELRAAGYDVRLWNGTFLQELLARWPARSQDYRQPRPYQSGIVERSLEKYSAGGSRVQFVVATGLGKTVIASEILSNLFGKGLNSALVLCHSQELALQLEQSFWSQIDKSIPTRVFFEGSLPKAYEGINFGLYQTFSNRLSGVEETDYDVVIVDEAHHAMAYGFRRCLEYLQPRLLVGMTATPWRGDGVSIDGIFGPPVAQVSLVDGMKMGYLAQADYRIYSDTMDWDDVTRSTHGRMNIRDLNKRLFIPQRDEAIVEELVKQASSVRDPRVIIFCASIEHCKRFAEMLTVATNLSCRQLSGLDRVERNRALMDFASGRVQAVTAVDVLNEGIDVPDVNILVFLRSTHSRRIFVQQLGRGLRPSIGKDKLLVLDFVTDIRRIAEVIEMDQEAQKPMLSFQPRRGEKMVTYFKNGLVTFMNKGAIPFTQQWLQDVADLEDTEDVQFLKFPEVL